MSISVKFKWDISPASIVKRITGNDKAQLFLANESRRLMNPYVPFANKDLSSNVRVYVEDGKGVVEYVEPYARFQYYGVAMVGVKSHSAWAKKNESKIVTGKKLHYNQGKHKSATSYWDRAMLTARKKDLTRAVQNYIDKE